MPWEGEGVEGVLENEQGRTRGDGESKQGNLEQTYSLNVPILYIFLGAIYQVRHLGRGRE